MATYQDPRSDLRAQDNDKRTTSNEKKQKSSRDDAKSSDKQVFHDWAAI